MPHVDKTGNRTEHQLKTHKSVTQGGSSLSRYQEVVVGSKSFMMLCYFEFCMLLSIFPGALGLFLRKLFWPRIFGRCGKGVVFGSNVVVRHPKSIRLGNNVVISEGCILDARNQTIDVVIEIDNDVILSNNVMISCKNGTVKVGANSGISANTIIHSTQGNPVTIGKDAIIGPHCYIVGGGNYNSDRFDIPIWQQKIKKDGGIIFEDDVWLAAGVTVVGGVTMKNGSIAAAGAVVTMSIPERYVCGGIPAKILKRRGE